MSNSWSTLPTFLEYKQHYDTLDVNNKLIKDRQRVMFFRLMKEQIVKHNSRYLIGSNLVRGIYGERPLAVIIIHVIQGSIPTAAERIVSIQGA